MTNIINKSESFIREIRQVEIYAAASYSFENNYKGILPNTTDKLYTFNILPDDYERQIPTKKRSGNRFFDISIGFPLLDLNKDLREELYERFNSRSFMVVLISNIEKTILGNAREPLTIDFIDALKDDGSGNDQFNISITGETLIAPKTVNI